MRRLLIVVVASSALAGLAFAALAWHASIDPIDAAAPRRFDRATIASGERLASLGNCSSCHSVEDAAPYSGGVPLTTPFGTIYGSNLTPDADTGLGRWSEAAFVRAMREGVARDGQLLYPAFPYNHFTHATDAQLRALYAFLMTRDAVRAEPPQNDLAMPFGWRPLIAGWNLLFLHRDHDDPPSVTSAPTARGAALVDSLGHCGACHTPRDVLAGEERGRFLGGAVIDGWYAPPLNGDTPSPIPWTADALSRYLRTGLVDDHAIAGGPMHRVVASLAHAAPADVDAIATAIAASMGEPSDDRKRRAAASRERARTPLSSLPVPQGDSRLALGASVYATACAECHDRGRDVSSNGALQMPLAVALYDEEPASLLRIVREGIVPADGEHGRWMPAFGRTLSDEQLIALASYLRKAGADAPPWPRLERAVEESKQ